MERKTQYDVVLNHLKEHGTITILDSVYGYGITRLSDVIYRLKKDGYNITSKMKSIKSRYGTTCVSEYKLNA